MPYIYAIIREKETGKLKYVEEWYNYTQFEDSVLCNFINYATSLSEAYCSCLPQISIKTLTYSEKKDRRDAYSLQQALDKFKAKNDVVAFSHRYGGFTHFDWNFNDDITFHIYTNFGFGSVSDFNVTFKYKDICLAPYSYYVKYRYSDYASVVRCTHQYYMNYEEWQNVMRDCLDFYEAIVNGSESHIFKWIKEQIESMVDGLANFLSSSSYTFYEERFNVNKVSKTAKITDDDFWIIKAEKISNSLLFIENLRVLPKQVEANKYSARLFEIVEDFVPMLSEKITTVKKKVAIKENKLHALENKGDYPLYLHIKEKYYHKKKWYFSSMRFSMIRFLMKLLNKLYPQYRISIVKQRLKALDALIKEIDDVTKNLNSLKFLQSSLEKSNLVLVENMEKYSIKQNTISIDKTD